MREICPLSFSTVLDVIFRRNMDNIKGTVWPGKNGLKVVPLDRPWLGHQRYVLTFCIQFLYFLFRFEALMR
jgi:hypothetical protein